MPKFKFAPEMHRGIALAGFSLVLLGLARRKYGVSVTAMHSLKDSLQCAVDASTRAGKVHEFCDSLRCGIVGRMS